MRVSIILFLSFIALPVFAQLPGDNFSYSSPSNITDTTPVAVGTAVASKQYCVTGWAVSNDDATVGTRVFLKDGTTTVWHCPAASLYGGCVQSFDPPICGSVNTALNVVCETTSAQVQVSVKGTLK